MYYLKSKDGSKAFYLLENHEYIVGRKDCNILISNDTSISRKHALILVKDGKIQLTDLGAKYKTFINNVELQANKLTEIHVNDQVKFGILHNIYSVEECKLNVTTSGLTIDEKKELSTIMEKIGGNIVSNWSKECSYLIVREIMLTLKILCALIEGQSMVTLNFWKDFMENVNKHLPLPNPDNYKPICSEILLKKSINFNYLPRRRTLFTNKIFVFKTKASLAKIESVIELAGGTCTQWNEKKLTKEKFSSNNPKYLLIQDNLPIGNQNDSFSRMINYLHSIGKRSIQFQEIAMAVVLASCEKDCNPDFNRTETFNQHVPQIVYTQNVMTANSESIIGSNVDTQEEDEQHIVIPETIEEIPPKVQTVNSCKRSAEQLNSNGKRIRKDLLTNSTNEVCIDGPSTSRTSAQIISTTLSQEHMENSEDIDVKPLEEIDKILNNTEELKLFKTQSATRKCNQKENSSNSIRIEKVIDKNRKNKGLENEKEAVIESRGDMDAKSLEDIDGNISDAEELELFKTQSVSRNPRLSLKRPEKEIKDINTKKIRLENEKKAQDISASVFSSTVSNNAREIIEIDGEIVTSTQIDTESSQKPIKSTDAKRTSLNPIGFIRCGSKENKTKTTAKITEFFNPFVKSNQSTGSSVNISAIDKLPSTSAKRRCSDDVSPDRLIKKSHMVQNPFSSYVQSKTKTKPGNNKQNPFSNICKPTVKSNVTTANPFSNLIKHTTKIKEDTTRKVNRDISSSYTFAVTVIDFEMEKNYGWLSKNTIIKEEKMDSCSKNEITEINEQIQRFAESFNNCVVIETEQLVVKQKSQCKDNEETITNRKNFKKFKKIQPFHIQTTIIPRTNYIDVVCENPINS